MPAAEPEVADAADPSAPSAHKSILKKTPSARAPTPSEEHEDEDHFDALFGALLPADATVALVVADWRAKHAADPEGALAELYTLIARVRLAFAPRFPADTPRAPRAPRARRLKSTPSPFFFLILTRGRFVPSRDAPQAGGCAITLGKDELDASTGDEIGARVVSEMVAGNVYADDPLDDSGTRGSRKETFKHFKKHYAEFWDTLLRDSSETEELFVFGDENAEAGAKKNDGNDAGDASGARKTKRGDTKKTRDDLGSTANANGGASATLFDAVSDAVALFSGSRARTVRVAATSAGLTLVSSLVAIAKAKAETRDTKQRQLDAESRKKRPNAAMTRALAEALSETQARIRGAERMIADAFTKIFTHRFRDVDAHVRAQCMQSIGAWMRAHPLFFLSDVYLKYLGWSLSDKDPRVRRAVLAALRALYAASAENLALMDTFNARFQPRIAEMLHDVDASVAVEAIGTLAALHAAGVAPREEMQPVAALLLDGDARVRAAAARVVPALLAGDAAEGEGEEDEGIATEKSRSKKKSASAANDDGDAKTRETLMSLVALVRRLGGSRARTAGAVDALWDEYGDAMSEWGVILDAFLREEPTAVSSGAGGKKSARGKKARASETKTPDEDAGGLDAENLAATATATARDPMDADAAAGLANLLACAARRACGERLVQPGGRAAAVHQGAARVARARARGVHAVRDQVSPRGAAQVALGRGRGGAPAGDSAAPAPRALLAAAQGEGVRRARRRRDGDFPRALGAARAGRLRRRAAPRHRRGQRVHLRFGQAQGGRHLRGVGGEAARGGDGSRRGGEEGFIEEGFVVKSSRGRSRRRGRRAVPRARRADAPQRVALADAPARAGADHALGDARPV